MRRWYCPEGWESRRLPPLGGDDGQEYGYFLPPPPLPFLHALSLPVPISRPSSFPSSSSPPLPRPWPPSRPPSGPGAVFAPLRAGLSARPCGRGRRFFEHKGLQIVIKRKGCLPHPLKCFHNGIILIVNRFKFSSKIRCFYIKTKYSEFFIIFHNFETK